MSTPSQAAYPDKEKVSGTKLPMEARSQSRARPVPPIPERPAAIRVTKHGQDKKDSSQLNSSASTQSKVHLARPIPPVPSKKQEKPAVPPRPKVDGETSTNHRSVVGPDSSPFLSSFDSVHSNLIPPDRPTPVTRKLLKHGAPPKRPNFPPVLKTSTFLSSSSPLPSSTSKAPPSRPPSLVPTVSSDENTLQSSASVDHCTKPVCPSPKPQPRTSLSYSSSSSTEKLTCVAPPKPQPRKRVPSAAANTPPLSDSSNNLNDNNNNTNINNNNNLNDVNNNVNSNAEEFSIATVASTLPTTSVDTAKTTDELLKDTSPLDPLPLAKASQNVTSHNSVTDLTADSHNAISSTSDSQFISSPKCAIETASSDPVDLVQFENPDSFSHSQQKSDFPVPSPRLKQQLDIKPENNNDSFRMSPSEELCDFQLPLLEDSVSDKSSVKRPTIIRPVEKSDTVCSSEEPIQLSSGKRGSLPRPSRPPLPANRNSLKNSSSKKSLPRPPPPIPKAEPVSTNNSSFTAPLCGSSDLSAKPQPGMKKPSKFSECAESQGTNRNESPTKDPETKIDSASRLKNFFSRKGSTPSPPTSDKKPVTAKNRKAAEMLQTTKDYTKRISETLGLTAEKPSAIWYTEDSAESEQQVKPAHKPPHKPPPKPPHKSQMGPTTWYVEPEESTRSQKKKKVPERPPCSPLELTKTDQQSLQTTDERDDGSQRKSDGNSSININSGNAFQKYHNSFKTSIENLTKIYEGSQISVLDLDNKDQVEDNKILHPKSDIQMRRPPEPPRPKSQMSTTKPNSDSFKQPLQKPTHSAVTPPPKPKVPPQKQEIVLNTPLSPVSKQSEIDSDNINVALKETRDLENTNVESESSGVFDLVNQFEHTPNSLMPPPKSPKPVENTSNICDNIKTEIQPNQSETADVINTSQENLVCSDENENLTNVVQNETFSEMANNNFSSSKSNLMQETIALIDENANEGMANSMTSGDLTEAELKIENSIAKQSLPYNKMSNSLNTRCVNLIKDLKSSFEKSSLEGSTQDMEESSVTATTDNLTLEVESSTQEMLEHTDNVEQNSLEVEENSSVIAEGLHERAVESLFDVKPNQTPSVESSSEVVQNKMVQDKIISGKDPEIKTKLKPKPQRPPSLPSSLCCTSVKASVKQDTQLPNVATGEICAQTDKTSVVDKKKSSIIDTATMKVTEPYAVAEFNFETQEVDELSLKKGDHVRLLSWIDSNWLYGTCNGSIGIFPKGFVKIIQPLSNPPTPVNTSSDSCGTDPSSVSTKEDSINDATITASDATEVTAFDNTIYASLSEVTTGTIAPTNLALHTLDSPALKEQEQINCDLISPTQTQINFDEAHSQNDASVSLDDETTDSELIDKVDFPVGGEETIAITLYDFEGEEGELSFKAQQEVTVLKWVNNDWLWGRIGDRTGNLPANFVDFVADNSFEENLEPIGNMEPLMDPPAPSTDTLENVKQVKDYARARYDFVASTKDDLSFRKGDRIEVLEFGSDWAQGRLNKKVGYFPTAFVSFEEDSHNEETEDNIAPTYEVVKALFDFKGLAEDELSFEAGDLIFCLGEVKSCPGWSQGTLNSQTGIFPTNFVSAPISNP